MDENEKLQAAYERAAKEDIAFLRRVELGEAEGLEDSDIAIQQAKDRLAYMLGGGAISEDQLKELIQDARLENVDDDMLLERVDTMSDSDMGEADKGLNERVRKFIEEEQQIAADPVEPTADPVEPTADPVEPTADPVEPTADPVEPVTEFVSEPGERRYLAQQYADSVARQYTESWKSSTDYFMETLRPAEEELKAGKFKAEWDAAGDDSAKQFEVEAKIAEDPSMADKMETYRKMLQTDAGYRNQLACMRENGFITHEELVSAFDAAGFEAAGEPEFWEGLSDSMSPDARLLANERLAQGINALHAANPDALMASPEAMSQPESRQPLVAGSAGELYADTLIYSAGRAYKAYERAFDNGDEVAKLQAAERFTDYDNRLAVMQYDRLVTSDDIKRLCELRGVEPVDYETRYHDSMDGDDKYVARVQVVKSIGQITDMYPDMPYCQEYPGMSLAQINADNLIRQFKEQDSALAGAMRDYETAFVGYLDRDYKDKFTAIKADNKDNPEGYAEAYQELSAEIAGLEDMQKRQKAVDDARQARRETSAQVEYMARSGMITDDDIGWSAEHARMVPGSYITETAKDLKGITDEEMNLAEQRVNESMAELKSRYPDREQVAEPREKQPLQAQSERQPPQADTDRQSGREANDNQNGQQKNTIEFHKTWTQAPQQQIEDKQNGEPASAREERKAARAARQEERQKIVDAKKNRRKELFDKIGQYVKDNPAFLMAGSAAMSNMDGGDYVKLAIIGYAAYKLYDRHQAKQDGTYEGWFAKKARQIGTLSDKVMDKLDTAAERAENFMAKRQDEALKARTLELTKKYENSPDPDLKGFTKGEVNAVINSVAPAESTPAMQELKDNPAKLRQIQEHAVVMMEHENAWAEKNVDLSKAKFYVNGEDGKPIEDPQGRRLTLDPYGWTKDFQGSDAERAQKMADTDRAVRYMIDHNGATAVAEDGTQIRPPKDAYTQNMAKYDSHAVEFARLEQSVREQQLAIYQEARRDFPDVTADKIPLDTLAKCAQVRDEAARKYPEVAGMSAADVYFHETDKVHMSRLAVSDSEKQAVRDGMTPDYAEAKKLASTVRFESDAAVAERRNAGKQADTPPVSPDYNQQQQPNQQPPKQSQSENVIDVEAREVKTEPPAPTPEAKPSHGKQLGGVPEREPEQAPESPPAKKGLFSKIFHRNEPAQPNPVPQAPEASPEITPEQARENVEELKERVQQQQDSVAAAMKTADALGELNKKMLENQAESGQDYSG